MRKLKLKHSIYIMIILCSFVPVFIWIMFSVKESEQKLKTVIENNIVAIGGSQAMSIQNFCEGRKENMEVISRMALVQDAIINYNGQEKNVPLNEFLKDNERKSYIASVSVVNKNFDVVGSSQEYEINTLSEFRFSNEKYHSGDFFLGNAYERELDSGMKRVVPAFIGVYRDEELIGYLIEEIDTVYFNRFRLESEFLEDGTLYIMDGKNQLITAGYGAEEESRDELVTTPEERADFYRAWNEFDHENNSEGVIHYEIRDAEYMTYFSNIIYTDWKLRITESMTAQWESNQSMYGLIIMEGAAVVIILLIIQVMMSRKLIEPFNKMVQTMKDIQDTHNYSLRTGITGKDEVAVVGQGIDELLAYIEKEELEEKRRHRELEEKANAEVEVLHHKEFLSAAMLENMPSGYHRCTPDVENGFTFLQLGSHIEEILGWSAEEIKNEMGNCYRNLIWPEDIDVAMTYTEMVTMVGKGNSYDTSVYRMKHKDGGYRWITDATMFVDLGEDSFFQGVIADITPYVEGMEEAKRQAEESSRAKTDFLSQMSHDIRTPMNAIIGFTNLAKKETALKAVIEEYIPKIETASHQLLMIINDVLEMNSIEKGNITFQRTASDMMVLLKDIMTVMEIQAEKKELHLISDFQVRDRYIYCDENRFNRVFINLMSNAIKFTPEGGTVKFSIVQQGEVKNNRAAYLFKVSDTGIGMSPEFTPMVFDPFERERTSTVSRVQGTGLGMAIVKSIVDAAEGVISVESKQGEGTTFTIEMTMELVEPEVQKELEQARLKEKENLTLENLEEYFKGKRVLLVEDNEFNRTIAEAILEEAGFVVETAEDGHLAVEKVKTAPSEDYYDVILMDVQMPIMNGYEATKAIRALKGERNQIKIIAVTANAFETDRQLAKEAGMNEHLPKPIDVQQLYTTLRNMM